VRPENGVVWLLDTPSLNYCGLYGLPGQYLLSRYHNRIFVYTQCEPLQKRGQMFRLIWQIYTTGIVIFFLVFLLAEAQPFGPALINAIFWPAGVYNTYISVG